MISVIVPAHNEARVIGRCLRSVTEGARPGELEVIVVCNGSTDGTAAVAGAFEGVRVIESREASKAAALNLGDLHATGETRIIETLHEGIFSFISDLIDGRVHAPLWLRGAAEGQAVISDSRLRAGIYRERVRLYDLENPGTAREIGDFDNEINRIWDESVTSQVKVFDARVLWYNPDDNRIVVYNLETLRKQKFRP